VRYNYVKITNFGNKNLIMINYHYYMKYQKENVNLVDNEIKEYLITEYIMYEPKTWKQWEKLYNQTQLMMNVATKFVNEIIKTGNFMEFYTPEVPFHHYQWLPVEWFQYIHELDEKKHYNVHSIFYEITKQKKKYQYKIKLFFDDIGIEIPVFKELNLTKQEFIIYLAKLFYYQQNFDPDEIFIMNTDVDEPRALYIYHFLSNDSNEDIRDIFPDW